MAETETVRETLCLLLLYFWDTRQRTNVSRERQIIRVMYT